MSSFSIDKDQSNFRPEFVTLTPRLQHVEVKEPWCLGYTEFHGWGPVPV